MRKTLLIWLLTALLLGACSAPDEPTVGLYVAIKRGDIDQIERHIYWKTDINQNNVDGQTPLHESARVGRMVITRMLLDNGAEVNKQNRQQQTALEVALLNGRTQIVQMLIDKYQADFDATRQLFIAVNAGVTDRDIVRFLVARKAAINSHNDDGQTPLSLAVSSGNRLLSKHLIQKGADVNVATKNGQTPLMLARDINNKDLQDLLLANGAGAE